MQREALERAGVAAGDIFSDKMSGAKVKRPGLENAIKACWPGDILVVWKLDRLGRSLIGTLDTMKTLNEREIDFRSITEQFDTSTPAGKALMQLSMVFAELERNLISERTKAGIASRKARGLIKPRWHGIRDVPARLKKFHELDAKGKIADVEDGGMTMTEIVNTLNAAGPKNVKPFSMQSYNQWRKNGFNGVLRAGDPEFGDR